MRSRAEREAVLEFIDRGLTDTEIARIVPVPRRTIWDWRRAGWDYERAAKACAVCGGRPSEIPAGPYAYILGLYLGDGSIATMPRTYRLMFACDARYPGIIERCARALSELMPGNTAGLWRRPDCRCIDVRMYSNHWPCFFPQHGPGRKHERKIFLADWQQRIVDDETARFLAGLIHSDGCRVSTLDRGLPSVRYHFSDRSSDIRRIFCAALGRVGVHWTQNSRYSIAVYRKRDTALLDSLIERKT